MDLRDSQRVALERLCEPGRTFGALWAEPRSGKTAVALRWLQHTQPPVAVVVAPKVAESVWRAEAAKWLQVEYRFYPLTKGNEYPDLRDFHGITLLFVNYEQFGKSPYRRLQPFLKKVSKWAEGKGAMLLDESHMIKTPSAVTGRHIRKLAYSWKYRLIMTGTPVTNPSQIDAIYGQWTFLDPSIRDKWPSASDFRNHFGEWTTYKGFPELVRPIRQYELNAYIQPNVITMTGSGAKLRTILYRYKAPASVTATCDEMLKNGVVELGSHTVIGLNPLTRLLRMRTLVAGWAKDDEDNEFYYPLAARARLKALRKVLDKTDGKVIVACTHLYEIKIVARMLRKQGIGYYKISGSTKDKNRTIEKFQLGSGKVLLVQPRTVSMAVDISVANDLVWYSSDFNYVTFKQASDRIKLSPARPTVWFLCAKGSVDEDVWQTLTKDHNHLNEIVGRIRSGRMID